MSEGVFIVEDGTQGRTSEFPLSYILVSVLQFPHSNSLNNTHWNFIVNNQNPIEYSGQHL